ncbi:hypothetical protein QP591_02915 [Aerococcus urinae]|nr:hypothetical protein [Aerococcus urinae]
MKTNIIFKLLMLLMLCKNAVSLLGYAYKVSQSKSCKFMILLKKGGKALNKRNKKGGSGDRSFILYCKPLGVG